MKFFYLRSKRGREKYGWTILLPNYSKLFVVFHPQFSRIRRSFQTSSSLKFLLVKLVSRESREKSFAGKRSCPPDPFLFAVLAQKWPRLKRFTASFGSDTFLPPFFSSLWVMQISRRKLKFREILRFPRDSLLSL